MTHSSSSDCAPGACNSIRDLNRNYYAAIVRGLAEEAIACCDERNELAHEATAVAEAAMELASDVEAMAGWREHGRNRYRELSRRLANALCAHETIARQYENMNAFWDDAQMQARGDSPYTFWDVYEHGARRRLEHIIAHTYGAEDALLVNSGMSAIAVAIEAASLRTGDTVEVSSRGYFETTDLLDRVTRPRGVTIRHAAPTEGPVPISLALLEVADATPGAHVPLDETLNRLLDGGARIVIDNSMFGPTAGWPGVFQSDNKLLFVESTAKFIGREVIGGVIYGTAAALDPVRLIARDTGQQLQAHAFHWLRPAEIAAASLRLKIHQRNVEILLAALNPVRSRLELCTPLRSNFRCVGQSIGGCVVFLRATLGKDGEPGRAPRHRDLLSRWQSLARSGGRSVGIRAGYGWDDTTARCYEGHRLKQANVDDYIRISVGIEDASQMSELSAWLSLSIEEVLHD